MSLRSKVINFSFKVDGSEEISPIAGAIEISERESAQLKKHGICCERGYLAIHYFFPSKRRRIMLELAAHNHFAKHYPGYSHATVPAYNVPGRLLDEELFVDPRGNPIPGGNPIDLFVVPRDPL